MMIIIVGPDGAGKSTLAVQLSEQTGYPIQHRHKPKNQKEKEQMMRMYQDLVSSGESMILDRAWYCEYVYGSVMRDKSYISIEQMHELEKILAKNGGGIIIHCTDSVENLWNRCQKRGEDYITEYDQLLQVYMEYIKLLNYVKHYIPIVEYRINENVS